MVVLEVCIDSHDSLINAIDGGADRIEVCRNLNVGGITPNMGFFQTVKHYCSVDSVVRPPPSLNAIIRPQETSSFCYNEDIFHINEMIYDIKEFKKIGADGVVFGALTEEDGCNIVDIDTCKKLLEAAQGMSTTFHRAFDDIPDKERALEELIELGFDRVLTSGVSSTAHLVDAEVVSKLVQQANNRIIVMPGAGVRPENIVEILEKTGAIEIHSSARCYSEELQMHVCSSDMVKSMIEKIKSR